MATASTGITKRIVPLGTYPFGNLAGSQSSAIVVGQHVDSRTFTEADLMVRFHAGTTITSGAFTVAVAPDGFDLQDPTAVFITIPSGLIPPPGSVRVSSATTFPFFSVVAAPVSGRLLAVVLVATQGTGGDPLTAVMSVDLVLKGGDSGMTPMMPNGYCGYRII